MHYHRQENSYKDQLVNILTLEVATSVVGLAADMFPLCTGAKPDPDRAAR